MKKTAVSLLVALAFVPVIVGAQTSDDVILDLLRSLEGPPVSITIAATTSATTVVPQTSPLKTTPTPTNPIVQIMPPLQLFSIDGNQQKPDPNVAVMKNILQLLVAQHAALTASTAQAPPVATTSPIATSTEEAPPARFLFKKDLRQGSRGPEVIELQKLLIARKLLFGEPTAFFGILTKTALITFQEELGLPGVGTVGPKTREILNALPADRFTTEPPVVSFFGTPSVAKISSSTSAALTASSTGTSTPSTGTSSPMFDFFAPPVSVSMSLLPSEAPVGGSTAVTWISQNATSCVASDGWDGPKPTLGAARIEPLQFSLNFVITCTGPGGIASTSALVVVGGEE